jgi:hypothetical protein
MQHGGQRHSRNIPRVLKSAPGCFARAAMTAMSTAVAMAAVHDAKENFARALFVAERRLTMVLPRPDLQTGGHLHDLDLLRPR